MTKRESFIIYIEFWYIKPYQVLLFCYYVVYGEGNRGAWVFGLKGITGIFDVGRFSNEIAKKVL